MAMVNPMLNLVNNPNVKDSRWLTLEVCREFQRNKCTRTEQECKFAHPPPHVEVQNGRVIACFDSIKGKCQRENPKCKYLHPPQHLREQLLQNGRNNLILKNLQLQAAASTLHPYVPAPGMIPFTSGKSAGYQSVSLDSILPGQYPLMAPPYMNTMPSAVNFNPYMNASINMTVPSGVGDGGSYISQQIPGGVIPTQIQHTQQKVARPDRLEVCREFQRGTCTRQPSECRYAHPPDNVTIESADNHVTVCMDFVKGKCIRDSCRYFHPPSHLQTQIKAAQQRANAVATQTPSLGAFPNMVPHIKRLAVTDSKSGIPVYQPSSMGMGAAYQHATMMQLQQQPYIPVTFPNFHTTEDQTYTPNNCWSDDRHHQLCYTQNLFAGHPPSVQRF
ncbi:muscleblind-like protein 3 isoform X2 [Patella vulgata]|uniref:muscleblind-like protein 3 isoform X2 n=1 Tax=Patella vulgata TaxID=6465 RepID=UPI00217F96C1|nr:muscleblind-like protein 3 isoform X2 [Patella vulgata]